MKVISERNCHKKPREFPYLPDVFQFFQGANYIQMLLTIPVIIECVFVMSLPKGTVCEMFMTTVSKCLLMTCYYFTLLELLTVVDC